MNKVVISPIIELRRYVSRELFATYALLEREHGWALMDVYDVKNSDEPLTEMLRRRFGSVPGVVLFREAYRDLLRHVRGLVDAGTRVYVMTEDLHHGFEGMGLALRVADGILCPYAPRLAHFYPDHDPARVTWCPHAAGPDFLLEPNDDPRPMVFVSGMLDRRYYPLRVAMAGLARRRPELACVHEHPGYGWSFDYDRDERIGRGYAQAMRSCLAAFTDASRLLYIVAKHFEIPATGALLIAERAAAPQLERLGFIDGTHYVSASADDLEAVVERVLDPRRREEVDAIRRRGHRLVHERHTVRDRAHLIDSVCV